jgi:pyruvate dehydrogenase E2 component (dihydrolipoamide acetyltransferase)
MPDVVMPRLSDSMEEGTILKWLRADGDQVERGEELVEIETDKATMPYEADASGTLHIIAAEGDTLPIGQTIATIGEPSPALAAPAARASAPAEAAPAAAPAAVAEPAAAPAPAAAPPPPVAAATPPAGNGAAPSGERVKASPIARRIARERGVNLQAVTGTGPGGRIVKADVEGAQPGAGAPAIPAAPAPATAAAPPPPAVVSETGTAKGDVRIEELSRMQQLVARRMAESRATVPDFTLTTAIDMERCVEMRADLKAATPEGGTVPSYNDMVVKACALALREYPRANGSYRDGHFELFSRVNVGVAVAAQDALVVPTVFDADSKSLGQIARDARALAERVRANAITPPELSGGTFTVSNLGMFGVTRFNAVINPPQAAILAVGALEQRAVVVDGEVVARHQMDVTLACDHRILYGADAARFLARVRELLEQPLALVL